MFHVAYFGKDEDDVAEHIELLHDLVESDRGV